MIKQHSHISFAWIVFIYALFFCLFALIIISSFLSSWQDLELSTSGVRTYGTVVSEKPCQIGPDRVPNQVGWFLKIMYTDGGGYSHTFQSSCDFSQKEGNPTGRSFEIIYLLTNSNIVDTKNDLAGQNPIFSILFGSLFGGGGLIVLGTVMYQRSLLRKRRNEIQ
jgi:hypothetical protein